MRVIEHECTVLSGGASTSCDAEAKPARHNMTMASASMSIARCAETMWAIVEVSLAGRRGGACSGPLSSDQGDSRARARLQSPPGIRVVASSTALMLLPLSFFSETDTIEAKMDLCYAAFEDLLVTHDAEATGKGVVWMVRGILREINDVLADNVEAKQAFCMRLKRHPWFEENSQIVRWQDPRARSASTSRR
ncbi:unnamed protein product [Prorocentrum cordatum]|uniref:Uncharacterized protein n=1 Tax=Prorocentrum cordatum TaxID=2364126 RepID=A0ABN9TFH6_9DINO|nr:unnamed protein product [Polarella glacialis]